MSSCVSPVGTRPQRAAAPVLAVYARAYSVNTILTPAFSAARLDPPAHRADPGAPRTDRRSCSATVSAVRRRGVRGVRHSSTRSRSACAELGCAREVPAVDFSIARSRRLDRPCSPRRGRAASASTCRQLPDDRCSSRGGAAFADDRLSARSPAHAVGVWQARRFVVIRLTERADASSAPFGTDRASRGVLLGQAATSGYA